MTTPSMPHNLQLFVDGSYDPLKRLGGWGVISVRNDVHIGSRSGSISCADNSAPELVAVLEALRWLEVNAIGEAATIWSDSFYAVTGCNKWRHIWRTNQWRKRAPNGKGRSRDVPNSDLWRALDACLTRCDMIEIAWCKGHVGLPWNEQADALARHAAKPAVLGIAGS
ncbi:RNase H family protein [Agrobacterium sp. SORGH_AS 787]|uniref:RNase H family protein n=1 Tax=Agrobacterium sp. SORGH_AS 787 TaxID=3041775 RepID=UPI0032B84718